MNYEQRLTDKRRQRFAFMLRQKRKDNKITLKELGNKLGYSTATISNWENLKAVPDMYNVEDVATYFNLPINVLVGEK
ncbi:transcriptional regulator [Streptococcus pneumoniae]|jgi:transcriptional regulator|nr:transcriptional regulator [Streptococcus pneumoniae]DAW56194.1 MAG TPA: helix-turn-helix domain protein [Caudoviricetes sp.]